MKVILIEKEIRNVFGGFSLNPFKPINDLSKALETQNQMLEIYGQGLTKANEILALGFQMSENSHNATLININQKKIKQLQDGLEEDKKLLEKISRG